jgi:integrase/recombinase XerD
VFEQLFKRRPALARQRNGPLAEERRRYLAHCADQQMAHATLRGIAIHMLIVVRALRLADRTGESITRAEIEATADRWANRHPRPHTMRGTRRSRLLFISYATRWLTFLERLQPAVPTPRPYADQARRFVAFMLEEQGLSVHTVAYRSRMVEDFLTRLTGAGLQLEAVTVAQLDELLARRVQEGYARVSVRTYASTLRAFFRFAEANRWCRRGLATEVMAPRVFRHEGLPVGPSWDDVNRLLATLAGDTPTHVRDRALVLLVAVYGLRTGEVVSLRLEDFDWEQERLFVRAGKRPQPRIYPLDRPVGQAVLRYLREVRPRSSWREVFLTLCAPFRPLSRCGLGRVVSQRLRALGVALPHYGPHALRHACATHLLARGLSLKEIGDHLGHRSPESTRLYAKVDLAGLRTVADFNLEGLV